MKTEDVLNFFTNQAAERCPASKCTRMMARSDLAEALDVTFGATYQWKRWVPERRALQLQTLTHGKLKIHPDAPYGSTYYSILK